MSVYSHSRLSSFEKCKLQYKYRYLDKIRREVQSIEAFLGNRVHEVLEELYRDVQMERIPSKEELLELYRRHWERSFGEKIRIVRAEYTAEHYRQVGERCLTDFYRTYHPFRDGVTMGLEEKVSFPLDPEGRYQVRGFVDRIVRVKPDVFEIHDYKTGGSLPSREEVEGDRQLAFYHIGVQRKFPEAREIHLVWHYLAFNQEFRSRRSARTLDDLRTRTLDQIRSIESTGDFPPTESALCRWCEYLDLCPLWKHRLKAEPSPVNEHLADTGVQLVDRLAEAEAARKKVDGELVKIRKALRAFAEREGVEVVSGTHHEVHLREEEQVHFPAPGETGRRGLEMVLREMGQYESLARLDEEELVRIFEAPDTDRYLKAALEKFARREKRLRLRLVPKDTRQLDLFD